MVEVKPKTPLSRHELPNVNESHFRHELLESWTQTLDFSKKKKGTQCDDIDLDQKESQVSAKDFLAVEEQKS